MRIITISVLVINISLFSANVSGVVFKQPFVLRISAWSIPVGINQSNIYKRDIEYHCLCASTSCNTCHVRWYPTSLLQYHFLRFITIDTDDDLYHADKAFDSSTICFDSRNHKAGFYHNVTLKKGSIGVRARPYTSTQKKTMVLSKTLIYPRV